MAKRTRIDSGLEKTLFLDKTLRFVALNMILHTLSFIIDRWVLVVGNVRPRNLVKLL